MIYRETCFACTTPYQILGAISIAHSFHLDADIYIFGMFKEFNTIAERLGRYNLFKQVIPVDCTKYYNHLTKYGNVIKMLRSKKIVQDFLSDEIRYSKIFTSSRAHIKNIFLRELLRRNKDLQIVVYEDGLGMYAHDSHVLNTTPKRRFIENILGWNLYTPERVSYMVNIPEIFEKPEEFQGCIVRNMPKLDWSDEDLRILMDVFGVEEDNIINEHVIIFDSFHNLDPIIDKKMKLLDECFAYAADYFGKDNVIVKPHPRSSAASTAFVNQYRDTSVPMEVLYSFMDHIEDRVLITYASTAVYTPKIFFDKEPWVINLFRITDNINGSISEWEETFYKFKSIYRDADKIMAPESIEEFKYLLGTVSK